MHKNSGRKPGGRKLHTRQWQCGGVAVKHAHTKTDTKMETGHGREVGTSQSHSRHKKALMTNIYLMDLDEEAIVDFVKDHKELYNKPDEQFMDKESKACLRERFTNSCKLSIKVCKTWFELLRTCYDKLTQSKSGQAPKDMKERQNWIQDKFNFLKMNIRCKRLGLQVIRHHNTAFSYKPQHSFWMFCSRPAGHGPVCTDENHAVIIPQVIVRNNKNCLLQLPGI